MNGSTGGGDGPAGPGLDRDPGWGLAGAGSPVATLRMIFLSFAAGLVLLFLVLAVVLPATPVDGGVPSVAVLLLAVGLVGPVGAAWARRRPIACGEPGAVASRFQTNLFIGLAVAEVPALLGFAASFLADAYWPYLAGLALAAVGFALIAPTRTRIAQADERLTRNGCRTSLREALYTTRS